MMSDELPTIMFHNDTLLMKMPDPYLDVFTKTGKKYRKKLGDRKFSFELSRITPNVTVGDYFIVRHLHSVLRKRENVFLWSTYGGFSVLATECVGSCMCMHMI